MTKQNDDEDRQRDTSKIDHLGVRGVSSNIRISIT